MVRVEGVVGGLAAGQGRGLRGLLQDAHAVAEVVRLLQHNIRNKYILHFVTSSHRIDCILQLCQPVCHDNEFDLIKSGFNLRRSAGLCLLILNLEG